MTDPAEALVLARWPSPADARAAGLLAERLPDAAWRHTDAGRAMVAAIGGNSPYLADLAVREATVLERLADAGPAVVVQTALAELAAIRADAPSATVAAGLRRAKRQVALAVAVADVGTLWRLDAITGALSDLADAALRLAVAHALHRAHLAATGSGFVVLAMGKLGARELNYSSDIDLVLLHDPRPEVVAADHATATFTRVARDMVALLETRDADGYVFRTDLRLRPDPAATPPSMNLTAALSYYEAMAQSWERAAMVKARPVTGDLAVGEAFLAAIRPFVWRRGLDFALVADLQEMKRRIDAHKRTGLAAHGPAITRVLGHDVKLGQGGIREIEFLAQTLQLVWGGREPGLRTRRTVDALRALCRAGHLGARTAGELIAAYRLLRRVEHRLQMVADRQTHRLPDTADGLAAFATFLGFSDAARFAARLLRQFDRVGRAGDTVFSAVPADDGGFDVPAQGPLPPELVARVATMGFGTPDTVLALVRDWQAGRPRALRNERARGLLRRMLPTLLAAIGRQAEPDAAFARLDRLFGQLPAGVQILSLFARNPGLIERIATVLGAAPGLAEHLATVPSALDGLLGGDLGSAEPAALLGQQLVGATLQDAIELVRKFVREEDFAFGVATLEGRLDADAAGLRRAALADAAIAALLPFVVADVTRRHGSVPGGALAVLLLGKAGSREMMAGSDLDLMLVYDHPAEIAASQGERPVAPGQWYLRATQGLVAALTAPDAGGALYTVDMRLRPSGNKGPVAVSRAALAAYYGPGGGAWTWERMALTRARVVAGDPALVSALSDDVARALAVAEPERVRADALAMRGRLSREATLTSGPFADLRQRAGGLIDVEFVAQALRLMRAPLPDGIQATRDMLAALAAAGAVERADAATLVLADRVWRTVIGMARLSTGRSGGDELGEAAMARLLDAVRVAGLEALDARDLRGTLDRLADDVRAIFVRVLGQPE